MAAERSSPIVLVTAWRRRGRVWGEWERDVVGAEWTYLSPLVDAGLTPLLVPVAPLARVAGLVQAAQGLVVIGGEDVHPDVSGARAATAGAGADSGRDRWEIALLAAALDHGLPVLAICRGMQLLNVAFGGSLHSDVGGGSSDHPVVPPDIEEALAHRHEVVLTPGSLLADVYGVTTRAVNSLHHQAVDRAGSGLRVTARAPDGGVEALELEDPSAWCAAMQWHPELLHGDVQEKALFDAFADRCAR